LDVNTGEAVEISQLPFSDLNIEKGMLYFRNSGEI